MMDLYLLLSMHLMLWEPATKCKRAYLCKICGDHSRSSFSRLKWKPLNENSVDFKVELLFPGSSLPGVKDYSAKPRINLLIWQGGNEYTLFSELGITDEEWERQFKQKPRYMDGKIIECNYDPQLQQELNLKSPWRFMRFRDDKPDGNHQSTVTNVLRSIEDAVSQEQVICIQHPYRTHIYSTCS